MIAALTLWMLAATIPAAPVDCAKLGRLSEDERALCAAVAKIGAVETFLLSVTTPNALYTAARARVAGGDASLAPRVARYEEAWLRAEEKRAAANAALADDVARLRAEGVQLTADNYLKYLPQGTRDLLADYIAAWEASESIFSVQSGAPAVPAAPAARGGIEWIGGEQSAPARAPDVQGALDLVQSRRLREEAERERDAATRPVTRPAADVLEAELDRALVPSLPAGSYAPPPDLAAPGVPRVVVADPRLSPPTGGPPSGPGRGRDPMGDSAPPPPPGIPEVPGGPPPAPPDPVDGSWHAPKSCLSDADLQELTAGLDTVSSGEKFDCPRLTAAVCRVLTKMRQACPEEYRKWGGPQQLQALETAYCNGSICAGTGGSGRPGTATGVEHFKPCGTNAPFDCHEDSGEIRSVCATGVPESAKITNIVYESILSGESGGACPPKADCRWGRFVDRAYRNGNQVCADFNHWSSHKQRVVKITVEWQ